MEQRPFGDSGFQVSILGFGASHIGEDSVSEAEAERMLNGVLDSGVTLIDTARGYGLSEERIGKFLKERRMEFLLSSKGGYSAEGAENWTPEAITLGIDQALKRLRTDVIDIFHLHSCGLDTLRDSGVVEALVKAREDGKIRCAAYSGENDALAWAAQSGQFDSLQCSINLCDQRSIDAILPTVRERNLGLIAKRPIANAFWRFEEEPTGDYCEPYWHRARAMGLSPGDLPWDELALRFSAFLPGVTTCIVGTRRFENFERNVQIVGNGPLPQDVHDDVRERFLAHDQDWVGQI